MTAPRLVLDACVLFPGPLRGLLLRLAAAGCFRPVWSAAIHREWMGASRRHRPDLAETVLETLRAAMDAEFPHACVEHRPSHALPALPDPGDAHVLALAVAAGAEGIVTLNLRDFPRRILTPLGLPVLHPDTFLCDLLARGADPVITAARTERAAMTPLPSEADFLTGLRRAALPRTAKRLAIHGVALHDQTE